jgi:O-antigen/teichoic acid export membrane protein
VGPKILSSLLNVVQLFGFQRPGLRPRWSDIRSERLGRLLRSGFCFFVLQISASLLVSFDNLLIAQVLGTEAVARYSVPMKMFNIMPTILFMTSASLWPAYREALTRGDDGWARRIFRKSIVRVSLVAAASSFALIAAGHTLILSWAGPKALPGTPTLLTLGLWAVLIPVSNAASYFLTGVGALRFRVLTDVAATVAAMALKVCLIRVLGLTGVVLGTVIAWALFTTIPSLVYARNYFRDRSRLAGADLALVS